MEQTDPPLVKSTAKSLRIVEELQRQHGGTLNDVVSALDMSKSTVHRHLTTLHREGFLNREGDEYYVGFRFLNLGEYTRFRRSEFKVINDELQELANRSRFEADHSVMDHGRVIVLHQDHEEENFWDRRSTGNYYYAHSSAAGKVIMAERPDEEVRRIVDTHGLPKVTPNTITDIDELLAELDRVREQGYALNDEESTEGLRCVGSAIHARDGQLLGAVSVSGPRYHISEAELHEDLPALVQDHIRQIEARFDDVETVPLGEYE